MGAGQYWGLCEAEGGDAPSSEGDAWGAALYLPAQMSAVPVLRNFVLGLVQISSECKTI